MAQALTLGLRKILTERPESLVLGQDIGTYGGAFKVTEGLVEDFGRPRVFSTPLCESASTGYALGLAVNGQDRKSTRLNSSHSQISYAVFCLKKKKTL